METLSRSQLADAANVNIETLRYYERRGILPEPPRSAANYRRYPKGATDVSASSSMLRTLASRSTRSRSCSRSV